jgi:hypothetical protein
MFGDLDAFLLSPSRRVGWLPIIRRYGYWGPDRPRSECIVGYPEVGRKRRSGRSVPCSPVVSGWRKAGWCNVPRSARRVLYASLGIPRRQPRSGPAQIHPILLSPSCFLAAPWRAPGVLLGLGRMSSCHPGQPRRPVCLSLRGVRHPAHGHYRGRRYYPNNNG